MRIIFAASPAIAIPSLRVLLGLSREGIHELAGVLTNPDAPRGRKGRPEPTETAAAASGSGGTGGFAILKPEKLDGRAREEIAGLKPDLLVSFAYGHIFGPRFLSLFPMGGINVHPSLLPKYRGASPIPAAILNRDRETGITIQRIALSMDTGNILVQKTIPLEGRETTSSLSLLIAEESGLLLGDFMRKLEGPPPDGKAQDEAGASYFGRLSRGQGLIDWSLGAAAIDARVRAFTPWPLSLTIHKGAELYILEGRPYNKARPGGDNPAGGSVPGMVLDIDKDYGILIQTGMGIFAASRLQYRTKKALHWRDFLNGARNFMGSVLGE